MSKKIISIFFLIIGSLLVVFNLMGLIGNLVFGLFDSPSSSYESNQEFSFIAYIFAHYNAMCILLILLGLILVLLGFYLRKRIKLVD